jgi:hypothetical protein
VVWQKFFGIDRLAWSRCLVLGKIRNSLVLIFFVVTWTVLFDFWASGLTIHTLFPPFDSAGSTFHQIPGRILRRLLHITYYFFSIPPFS